MISTPRSPRASKRSWLTGPKPEWAPICAVNFSNNIWRSGSTRKLNMKRWSLYLYIIGEKVQIYCLQITEKCVWEPSPPPPPLAWPVQNSPHKFVLKISSPTCHFKKEVTPYFMRKTLCHCSTGNCQEVYWNLLTYWGWRKQELNDNRSVEWAIYWSTEKSIFSNARKLDLRLRCSLFRTAFRKIGG